jgi:ketose-bisphosphate aldolase
MEPSILLNQARDQKIAIGQFNTSNFEITKAIIQAAQKTDAPVIIGTSEGERNYLGEKKIRALVTEFKKETSREVFLHADHCQSFTSFQKAVEAGYDSAQIDGSKLGYKKNLRLTKKCVNYAKNQDKNIMTEGELGQIKGSSRVHTNKKITSKKKDLTDPNKVEDFVQKTGIDLLAVAVGTAHGTYQKAPKIDFKRLKTINTKTNTPLVLHGGSGTPPESIEKAIRTGISKINVNTLLRKTYKEALQKTLKENPNTVTPYKIFPPVIKAVQNKIEKKINLFNSSQLTA